MGNQSAISNKIINATLTNNLGSVGCSLLQASITGEICVEDVNVGTVAEVCLHFRLRGSLVADQTNDQVLGVFRELLDKLKLYWVNKRAVRLGLSYTHPDTFRCSSDNDHRHVG